MKNEKAKEIKTNQNFRVMCEHKEDNIRWVEATFTMLNDATNYAIERNKKGQTPYNRIVEQKINGSWYNVY